MTDSLFTPQSRTANKLRVYVTHALADSIMNNTFNTFVSNLSISLAAINLYQAGQFREAIDAIHAVLDVEPNSWDARLMLAVCYYKTGQLAAAHRAFQHIADKTTDNSIRLKAIEGAHVTTKKLDKRFTTSIPAEFGCHIELLGMTKETQLSWL